MQGNRKLERPSSNSYPMQNFPEDIYNKKQKSIVESIYDSLRDSKKKKQSINSKIFKITATERRRVVH